MCITTFVPALLGGGDMAVEAAGTLAADTTALGLGDNVGFDEHEVSPTETSRRRDRRIIHNRCNGGAIRSSPCLPSAILEKAKRYQLAASLTSLPIYV